MTDVVNRFTETRPNSSSMFRPLFDHRGRATAPQGASGWRIARLWQLGFSEGVAGHITARDPELLDHFWSTPSA